MSETKTAPDPLLEAVANLSRYHREHEKHYSEAPLETALRLLRFSTTLKALAERWAVVDPLPPAPSPYAGAEDLNDDRAIEQTGVLFMEGEGEPAEITAIKRDLATVADDHEQTGNWLGDAIAALARTRLRNARGGIVAVGAVAMVASLAITATYHLGYGDFRSEKLRKPVTGDLVWSIPTLATLNPVGAPIAHAGLHVAAVTHRYDTDLFLPPH